MANEYQPEVEEVALSLWVNKAIELEHYCFPVQTLFVGQSAERPETDFVSIQITNDRATSPSTTKVSDQALPDGTYAYDLITHREGTVQIRCFGKHHRKVAKAIESSLDDPCVQIVFDETCVSVAKPLSDILDIPTAVATTTQLASVQDFQFKYAERRTRNQTGIHVIENVKVEGSINPINITIEEPNDS